MKGRLIIRRPVRRIGVIGVIAALGAGFILPASLPAAAVAPKDAVVEWNQHAANALIVTGLQPPTVAALHLAMVHGAIYDAVNAIDGGFEPYLVKPPAEEAGTRRTRPRRRRRSRCS